MTHLTLVLAAFFFYLLRGVSISRLDLLLVVLCLFVFAREAVAFSVEYKAEGFLVPLYLAFSIIAFNSVRLFVSDDRGRRVLLWGIGIATSAAVVGVFFKGYGATIDSEGHRAVGTFNNPNQLGYFSVCIVSLAVLSFHVGVIKRRAYLAVFFCAGLFLSVASLSKAAMLATAFAGLLFGFTTSSSRFRFLFGLIALMVIAAVGVMLYQSGLLDEFNFVHRIADIGKQDDDSFSERGYSVLQDASFFELVFGMGSQKVVSIVGHEVHSTVVSFIAGYGLIGGGGFMLFLVLWIKGLITRFGFIISSGVWGPPMLYGLTHNGSRFTIFWVLLAFSFAVGRAHVPSR